MSDFNQNVFVGVSLSNKDFTTSTVINVLEKSLSNYEPKRILFLIADKIEIINFRVFSHGSDLVGYKQIAKRTAEIESIIDEGILTFGKLGFPVIKARWESIMNRYYWNVYMNVFNIYSSSIELRRDLEDVALKYANRRKVEPNKVHLPYLSLYMLAEIPVLLAGIMHHKHVYNSMIYPAMGGETIDQIAIKISEMTYGGILQIKKSCNVARLNI